MIALEGANFDELLQFMDSNVDVHVLAAARHDLSRARVHGMCPCFVFESWCYLLEFCLICTHQIEVVLIELN